MTTHAQEASMAVSDERLAEQIDALLAFDAKGALVPHGVGGLARELLTKAAIRLRETGAGRVQEADPQFPDALPDNQIRIWINACNYEPARQALRQLLAYRVRGHAATLTQPRADEVTEATVKRIKTAVDDVLVEAHVDYPAGRDAGHQIEYDEEVMTAAIRAALTQPQADEVTEAMMDRAKEAFAALAGWEEAHYYSAEIQAALLAALQAKSQPEGGE